MTVLAAPGDSVLADAEAALERRDLLSAKAAFLTAALDGTEADRCAGGLWMTHMLSGDFSDAWRQSDAIRGRNAADPHRLWQGDSIDGKRVIVRCLHGFGDAVQMFQYLPILRERCARLIVEVPPRLTEIAPYFFGMQDVITWGENAPAQPPAWDVQLEIMELPYLFRTETNVLPLSTKYLDLPSAMRNSVSSLMKDDRKRVGLVWSTGEWNRSRAIPFHHIEALTREKGIEFWNLQGGEEHGTWRSLPEAENLRDGREAGDGILTLAALIQKMDLVITPDTLAAHLAGALGKTTWLVLQHAADWRWMHDRTDTPWYPSLRLFRQTHQGDWKTVMNHVLAALTVWKVNA